MIHSMTGFARASADLGTGRATWDLRSVNHRYLEIQARLPEEYRYLEPMVREAVAAVLERGKVEIALRIEAGGAGGQGLELDRELARRLAGMGAELSRELGTAGGLSAGEILQWPGVVRIATQDPEEARTRLSQALEAGLEDLAAARTREGEALAASLWTRIESLEEELERIRERLPSVWDALRQRLEGALADLRDRLDPDRLEQELALQVQRSDVAEEVERLAAHEGELRRVLESGGPVGRRLDFLLQEMNREANTLGSKSPDAEVGNAAVEVKVLIEQMREQAQNIE